MVRILGLLLVVLCTMGLTGRSCGYGEEDVDESIFNKNLSNPTLTVEPEDGEVTITWDDVSDAVSYHVFVSTKAPKQGDSPTKSSVKSPQKIENLINGTEYFIKVQSVDANGLISVLAEESEKSTPNPYFVLVANKDVTTTEDQLDTVKKLKELVGKSSSLSDESDNEEAFTLLDGLATMSLINKNIIDVSVFKSFKNLSELDLSENENLLDVSALGNVENIKKINLSKTLVTDVSFVLNLEFLESLTIIDNDGKEGRGKFDISTLAKVDGNQDETLKDFKELVLQNCGIEDLTAVAWLDKITTLDVKDNIIATMAAVVNFNSLLYLDVSGNNFTSDEASYDTLQKKVKSNGGTVIGP